MSRSVSFCAVVFPNPVPRHPHRWCRPGRPRLSGSPQAQDGGRHTGAPAGRSPPLSARLPRSVSNLGFTGGWEGPWTVLGEPDQAGEDGKKKGAFGSGRRPSRGSLLGPGVALTRSRGFGCDRLRGSWNKRSARGKGSDFSTGRNLRVFVALLRFSFAPSLPPVYFL